MKKYRLVKYCEFDKNASKNYSIIHNIPETLNVGDITKLDESSLEDFDFICGGSPCQDFSVAGKKNGSVWTCSDCGEQYNPLTIHFSKREYCPKCSSKNIEKTRSSLLVEWLRVIKHNKPKFGIYENVKNIVGKNFKETTFNLFIEELNEYGYNTYWEVMNAKDYGIPQNRERLILVLIRKDVDNGNFSFPNGFKLKKRAIDLLDATADEKYYIEKEKSDKMFALLKEKTKTDMNLPKVCEQRVDEVVRFFKNDLIGTLRTVNCCGDKRVMCSDGRVRKLLPIEALRFMGFDDEDYFKLKENGVSDSIIYKQAGNSIVVDVLFYVFKSIYDSMPYLFEDLKVASFFSGIGAFEKALDKLYENVIETK